MHEDVVAVLVLAGRPHGEDGAAAALHVFVVCYFSYKEGGVVSDCVWKYVGSAKCGKCEVWEMWFKRCLMELRFGVCF